MTLDSMTQDCPDKEFFARINIAAELTADWYDDNAWDTILSNIAIGAKAAKDGGAIGFCIDNECYNVFPFNYTSQTHRIEKTFDDYNKQVAKRGRQFASALCKSMPNAKLFITFSNSVLFTQIKSPSYISGNGLGLWPAFFDGMMEGAPQADFIDGYENYGLRTYADFEKNRMLIKTKGSILSGNPAEYQKRVKAALVASVEAYGRFNANDFSKNFYTPEEFKYALHYAMLNSDEYMWIYAFPALTAPAAYMEAIAQSRKPLPLDFVGRIPSESPKGYIQSAKGRGDCNDAVVFAALRKTYKELYDFPKQWSIKLDPQNKGTEEKWYTDSNSGDWKPIRIDDWWNPQLNTDYVGYAWYRVEFDVPSGWSGKKLMLAFGAVDEEAWLWINGKPAGSHAVGPDGWNNPFEIDITNNIIAGKNVLYIKVYSCAGVGGIWKSVKIFTK